MSIRRVGVLKFEMHYLLDLCHLLALAYLVFLCFVGGGLLWCGHGSFVECSTGARLEHTILNKAMLSLLGTACLCLSTWLSLGLLSSITISFTVLRLGYLGGFVDFCNKWPLLFMAELCISCLI